MAENSNRAIVIQRLRRLPGSKSRLTIARAGAASGQLTLRRLTAVVVAVCMLSVEFADELPGVMDDGVKVAVAPAGSPLAVSAIGFEKAQSCAVAEMV